MLYYSGYWGIVVLGGWKRIAHGLSVILESGSIGGKPAVAPLNPHAVD